MIRMTIDEWIERYEAQAEECCVLDGFYLEYNPIKGFMVWGVEQHGDDKYLVIDHTCTDDFAYWHRFVHDMAVSHGCKYMTTQTIRSPKAYVRKSGGAHLDLKLSGFRPNGKWYWVFTKETANDEI